jgi:hypothetical protein
MICGGDVNYGVGAFFVSRQLSIFDIGHVML